MSRADKYIIDDRTPYWSSQDLHPVHDTGPITIRMADIVASVHMHDALRSHRRASLVGRMVRTNRELINTALFNVGLVLAVVVGLVLINGGAW